MTNYEEKLEIVRNSIQSYPDFPKPGILFRDIFSTLQNPPVFKILHELLVDHISSISPKIEAVVALESRGFLFGPTLALEFEVPFIPIRKKGKLPGRVHSVTYDLEYGKDTLEIQDNNLQKGTRVLVVDDLLATGGSLVAACKLLTEIGLQVSQCLVVMELKELGGREKISAPVHSLIQF